MTTLFCDLVGFTAMGEAADSEDVDALLGECSDRARRVIESHGGTLEKLIGAAVVGGFGVPAARLSRSSGCLDQSAAAWAPTASPARTGKHVGLPGRGAWDDDMSFVRHGAAG